MKMLTVSLLVCAMMALTIAADAPTGEPDVKSGQEGTSSIVVAVSSCPGNWTNYSICCFLYVPSPMTWANAEKHCQTEGGNLASVHSFYEQILIQDMIKSQTSVFPLTWLGGYDATQEGTWFWSDGTPFGYTFWAPGQPDDAADANCLLMNFGDHKKFDNQPCHYTKPFVCAKNL